MGGRRGARAPEAREKCFKKRTKIARTFLELLLLRKKGGSNICQNFSADGGERRREKGEFRGRGTTKETSPEDKSRRNVSKNATENVLIAGGYREMFQKSRQSEAREKDVSATERTAGRAKVGFSNGTNVQKSKERTPGGQKVGFSNGTQMFRVRNPRKCFKKVDNRRRLERKVFRVRNLRKGPPEGKKSVSATGHKCFASEIQGNVSKKSTIGGG